MATDLELQGEIFRIFKGLKKNPLSRAWKPNFISKAQSNVTLQPDLLSKICKSIPATLIIGIKRFINSN